MKILQVHNYYQHAGGEDTVVKAERELLKSHGNDVIVYERDNDEINEFSLQKKIGLLWETAWSDDSFKEISALLKKEQPDVCHVHNFFPLISPAIFYACAEANIPVVQTLHNYRLMCANGLFFRDGHVCEDCLTGGKQNGIIHACYRDSRAQSLAVVSMQKFHDLKNTWREKIDAFICLTNFAAQKFIQGGLPADKIVVKQNFVINDPGDSFKSGEKYFLFVGRIEHYKGIHLIAEAAKVLNNTGYSVRIIGAGPDEHLLKNADTVEYLGKKPYEEVLEHMKRATAVIFASILYEGMPMTIIEAFACGTPVIASRLGGAAEIVGDGKTGLHFDMGNATDLAQKLAWAAAHPAEMAEMGKNARAEFLKKYTREENYEMMMKIYQHVIENKKKTVKL